MELLEQLKNVGTIITLLTIAGGVITWTLQYRNERRRGRFELFKEAVKDLSSDQELLKLSAIETLIELARSYRTEYYRRSVAVLREFLVTESARSRDAMVDGSHSYKLLDLTGGPPKTSTSFKSAFIALGSLSNVSLKDRIKKAWATLWRDVREPFTFGYVGIHRGTFEGGDFTGCELRHVRIDEAIFVGSSFRNCKFDNLRIYSKLQFQNCDLRNCSIALNQFDGIEKPEAMIRDKFLLVGEHNRTDELTVNGQTFPNDANGN